MTYVMTVGKASSTSIMKSMDDVNGEDYNESIYHGKVCYSMIQMILITIIVYGLLRLLEYIVVVNYKKYHDNGYGMEKMKNENEYSDRRSNDVKNHDEVEYMEPNVEQFYYLTKYGERVHTTSDCDGLRKRTQPVEKRTMCQLCKSGMSDKL